MGCKEKVEIWSCTCGQCSHKWLTRSDLLPRLCPKCKTMRWDTDLDTILDRSTLPIDEIPMGKEDYVPEEEVKLVEKQALLADLRGKIGAIEVGATKIPWKPEPIEEEWVFVGTSVQFADDGNAYRGQILLPHGKKRRSVQVDSENHESIIRIV